MEGLFALPKLDAVSSYFDSELLHALLNQSKQQIAKDIDDSFKCPQCQAQEISMPSLAQSLV